MTAKVIAVASVTTIVAVLIPTTIWLRAKRNELARRVKVQTKIDVPFPLKEDVKSIPTDLRDHADDYVCSIERAAKVVPIAKLPANISKDELLRHYLRANMKSFTYTPQVPLLKFMCKHADAKRTFEHEYLANLDFQIGDLVCGVFRVVRREERQIEMALDPHESFQGPKTEGRLVAKLVDDKNGTMEFVNFRPGRKLDYPETNQSNHADTIMWRRRRGGKPEILESRLGGWLHELMVMWLVDQGTASLIAASEH